MTNTRWPIVEVVWIDSRGVSESWSLLGDLFSQGVCEIRSVGYLAVDIDEYVVVLPHYGEGPEQGCGEMTIPRSAIREITTLRS